MRGNRAIVWLAGCPAMLLAAPAVGQAPADGFGPAPTETEFYEAADRSVHRVFGPRAEKTDWREPRRGFLAGNRGYSMCGHVRLTDRDAAIAMIVTWDRGDVHAVQLSWNSHGDRPFESTWDLPSWVNPSPYVDFLCAVWTGDAPPEEAARLDGPREGERFAWSPPASSPSGWRIVQHDRRWAETNDFGQLEDCVRIRTRPGRRYRITVEAVGDTRLSILKSRDCAGDDGLITWNDDMSVDSRNSRVEIAGAGNVYAFVRVGSGSERRQYALIVEEGIEDRPRP